VITVFTTWEIGTGLFVIILVCVVFLAFLIRRDKPPTKWARIGVFFERGQFDTGDYDISREEYDRMKLEHERRLALKEEQEQKTDEDTWVLPPQGEKPAPRQDEK
jgi:hypothetical protein